jgi:hypothetical protein
MPRQNRRKPSQCQRIMVAGRTRTTASCQSKSLANSARLMRVKASTLNALTPRSTYLASCRRRTNFSERIPLDERKNDRPSLKKSENYLIPIGTTLNMRSSCRILIESAAANRSDSCRAHYCGAQMAYFRILYPLIRIIPSAVECGICYCYRIKQTSRVARGLRVNYLCNSASLVTLSSNSTRVRKPVCPCDQNALQR